MEDNYPPGELWTFRKVRKVVVHNFIKIHLCPQVHDKDQPDEGHQGSLQGVHDEVGVVSSKDHQPGMENRRKYVDQSGIGEGLREAWQKLNCVG